jgi:hypothetical protein
VIAVLLALAIGAETPAVELVASSTCSVAEIDAIIAGHRELPSLARVQQAAREVWAQHAGDPAWAGRARLRGLVPRLDISVGTDADTDVRDTIDDRTTTEGRALGLRVAARFDLSDLVFAEAELRASRESAARDDELRDLLARATALYFERVELAIALRQSSSVPLILRARAVDGLLFALTGGRVALPSSTSTERTHP